MFLKKNVYCCESRLVTVSLSDTTREKSSTEPTPRHRGPTCQYPGASVLCCCCYGYDAGSFPHPISKFKHPPLSSPAAHTQHKVLVLLEAVARRLKLRGIIIIRARGGWAATLLSGRGRHPKPPLVSIRSFTVRFPFFMYRVDRQLLRASSTSTSSSANFFGCSGLRSLGFRIGGSGVRRRMVEPSWFVVEDSRPIRAVRFIALWHLMVLTR
jgi:hypothetical protein